MLIGELWSVIKHVLWHALLPLIWWLIFARRDNFFNWAGLKKISGRWKEIVLLAFFFFTLTAVSQTYITPRLLPPGVTVAEQYAGMGLAALFPAFCFGLSTGLGEEIFWRGFLGKRLCAKLGFFTGNTMQAFLFGLLHGAGFVVMFIMIGLDISTARLITIGVMATILAGFGAWLLGYLTEKSAGGSIIPAILVHGTGNFLLAMAEAFNLL